ncbi:gamma-glutamylaminecyclotransferase-like isoform X3 [Lingula anatina]|uniref:Gamma-glutamylcyclotransferase family protein n=1 Tax=Lingula anatina TaxID=7574 RepID=A0A1S3IAJ8_LINAN|nr:gamma-glutamylaminecyclotransferase-like isoform X3 [Lingula anatina]|eukprot:XP_013395290.1 gamma-glutamylaminecyclotransferase-like isoform X3 [Lingula anatina]
MASLTLHRVFVYGTLKRGEPNHHVMTNTENGTAKFVGEGKTTESWPLVIASKYNIPFLLHCKGKGQRVLGEVHEIDDKMKAFLDDFEGHPNFYERDRINIEFLTERTGLESGYVPSVGEVIQCETYWLKKFKPHMLEKQFLENYDAKGPHNLPYVESESVEDIEDLDDF